MRIVVAPRSRISRADAAANSSSLLERAEQRRRAARGSPRRNRAPGSRRGGDRRRRPQPTTRSRPSTSTRSTSSSSVSTTTSAGRPTAMPPDRRKPQHAGRHLGRRADGVLERHAERVQVPNGLDHRERAPGERAARARARRRPGSRSSSPPSRYAPSVEPCARHRVRDERHAPGGGAPDDRSPSRARGARRRG